MNMDGGNLHSKDDDDVSNTRHQSWFDWMMYTQAIIRKGLVGVLFLMAKQSGGSVWFAAVSIFCDAIQLLSLALPTDSTAEFTMPDTMLGLASVADAFNFDKIITRTVGLQSSMLVAYSMIVIQLVNTVYVGSSWVKQDFHYIWPIKLLRQTASVTAGVLYIPLLSTIATAFVSCETFLPTDEDALCVYYSTASILLATLFIPLSVTVALTQYDPDPFSKSPLAKPHSRGEFIYIVAKTVLIITLSLNGGVRDLSDFRGVIWLACLIPLSCGLAYSDIMFQPYYRHSFVILRAVLMSIFAWASLVYLMHNLLQVMFPGQFNVTLLLLVGMPIVSYLAILKIQHRLVKLQAKPIQACKSVFEVEMKVRILLRPFLLQIGILSNHRKATTERGKHLRDRVREVLSECSNMLFAAKNRSSLLGVIQAQFSLSVSKFELDDGIDRLLLVRRALLYCNRVNSGSFVDIDFRVFTLQHQLAEACAAEKAQGGNVINYVEAQKHSRDAIKFDMKACSEFITFWSELSSQQLDITKTRSLADRVAFLTSRAQSSYTKWLKLDACSQDVLNLYGGFLTDVANDVNGGNYMTARAERLRQVEERKRAVLRGGEASKGPNELDDLLSQHIGIIALNLSSGNREGQGSGSLFAASMQASTRVGEITMVNAVAAARLNELSDSIKGKDLRSYLFTPFTERFTELIDDFLQNGKAPLFECNIESHLVSTQGYAFPVWMRFKPFTSDGIEYVLYLTFVPREPSIPYEIAQTYDPQDYLVVDTTTPGMRIVGLTRGCATLLSDMLGSSSTRALTNLRTKMVTADDIFAVFTERISEFSAVGGAEATIQVNGHHRHIQSPTHGTHNKKSKTTVWLRFVSRTAANAAAVAAAASSAAGGGGGMDAANAAAAAVAVLSAGNTALPAAATNELEGHSGVNQSLAIVYISSSVTDLRTHASNNSSSQSFLDENTTLPIERQDSEDARHGGNVSMVMRASVATSIHTNARFKNTENDRMNELDSLRITTEGDSIVRQLSGSRIAGEGASPTHKTSTNSGGYSPTNRKGIETAVTPVKAATPPVTATQRGLELLRRCWKLICSCKRGGSNKVSVNPGASGEPWIAAAHKYANNDGKSVASSGTMSSTRKTAAVRKILRDKTLAQELDPVVRSLRFRYLLSALVCIAVAWFMHNRAQLSLDDISRSGQEAARSGLHALLVAQCTSSAQRLVRDYDISHSDVVTVTEAPEESTTEETQGGGGGGGGGGTGQTNTTATVTPATSTETLSLQLEGQLSILNDMNQREFDERLSMPEDLLASYGERVVPFAKNMVPFDLTLPLTQLQPTQRVALYEAVEMFVNVGTDLVYVSRQTGDNEQHIRHLLHVMVHNTVGLLDTDNPEDGNLHTTLRDRAWGHEEAINDQMAAIQERYYLIGAISMILSILLIVWDFKPLVNRIESNKSQVLAVFVGIPSDIVAKISERYTMRLEKTHNVRSSANTEESDDGIEDDEFAEHKHQHHPIGTLAGGTGEGVEDIRDIGSVDSDLGQEEDDDVFADALDFKAAKKLESIRRREKVLQQRMYDERQLLIEMLHRTTSNWPLLLKLSSMVILFLIFTFTVQILIFLAMRGSMKDSPVEIIMSSQQVNHLLFTTVLLRAAAMPLTVEKAQASITPEALDIYARSIAQVMRKHDVLLYGASDESTNSYIYTEQDVTELTSHTISMDGLLRIQHPRVEHRAAYFSDGCMTQTSYTDGGKFYLGTDFQTIFNPWLEDCADILSSVLSGGLHPMFYAFEQNSHRSMLQLEEYLTDLDSDYNRTALWNKLRYTTEFTYMDTLEYMVVQQVGELLRMNAATLHREVALQESLQFTISVSFIVIVCLVYLTVFRRLVLSLDNEVKRTRALLLMIPEDLTEELPALKQFLLNVATGVLKV